MTSQSDQKYPLWVVDLEGRKWWFRLIDGGKELRAKNEAGCITHINFESNPLTILSDHAFLLDFCSGCPEVTEAFSDDELLRVKNSLMFADLDGLNLCDLLSMMRESGLKNLHFKNRMPRVDSLTKLNDMYAELASQRLDYASHIAPVRRKMIREWSVPNGLKYSTRGSSSICSNYKAPKWRKDSPLDISHISVWNKHGKTIAAVTQPYDIYLDRLEEIVEFMACNDLVGHIHYQAEFHNPIKCFGIVYCHPDNIEQIPTLAEAIKGWRERNG